MHHAPRSGGTPDFPALIKYSCDLMTNVRFVAPARVSVPEDRTEARSGRSQELMSVVLGGKPVLTMAFDDMVVSAWRGDYCITTRPRKPPCDCQEPEHFQCTHKMRQVMNACCACALRFGLQMHVDEPERLALPQPASSATERKPRRRWQALLGMIPAWGMRA